MNVDLKGKQKTKKPLYLETIPNPTLQEQWKKIHINSRGHNKSYNLKQLHKEYEEYETLDEVKEGEVIFKESYKNQETEDFKNRILDKMNTE